MHHVGPIVSNNTVTRSPPSHSSVQGRLRRSNASLIMHRLEEVSRQPVLPPLDVDDPAGGLPTYDEAISRNGPHDAPPPPYPG